MLSMSPQPGIVKTQKKLEFKADLGCWPDQVVPVMVLSFNMTDIKLCLT